MQYAEGCRALTSVVPLKEGEEHCHYCSGFGAHPVNKSENRTAVNPERCWECDGKGKTKKVLF